MPETYPQIERRHLEHAVHGLEKTFAEQSQIVAKLLVISENTAKATERLDLWVNNHEADYRLVRERLLTTELTSDVATKRIEALTVGLETVMRTYMSDRNKAIGGWVALTAVISAAVGLLAALKSFGVI